MPRISLIITILLICTAAVFSENAVSFSTSFEAPPDPPPPPLPASLLWSNEATNQSFASRMKQHFSQRIAHGTPARRGQFPFATKIYVHKNSQWYKCGGALIYAKVVLTAAHCVYTNKGNLVHPSSLHLRIGIIDAKDHSAPFYSVDKILTPRFNSTTMHGDIALLHLTKKATAPAATAALTSTFKSTHDGTKLTVFGWGQKDIVTDTTYDRLLTYINVYPTNTATCHKLHSRTFMGKPSIDHFCTGPDAHGKVTCPGDSGSPFVYKPSPTSPKYVIVGVVSYGPDMRCGRKGNFDVATSVAYWKKWIDFVVLKYKLTR